MSDPFQNVDKAGNDFAEASAKTMEIRQSEPIMERIVESYLKELQFEPSGLLVEIGCGAGAISRRIAKHAENVTVLAFDPSANYISIAKRDKEEFPNLSFSVFDGEYIPIEDGKVDILLLRKSIVVNDTISLNTSGNFTKLLFHIIRYFNLESLPNESGKAEMLLFCMYNTFKRKQFPRSVGSWAILLLNAHSCRRVEIFDNESGNFFNLLCCTNNFPK